MITGLAILLVWCVNASICAYINIGNKTRIPRNTIDFFKLTFLPYLLTHLKEVRRK